MYAYQNNAGMSAVHISIATHYQFMNVNVDDRL
jgi:hypothetical protein